MIHLVADYDPSSRLLWSILSPDMIPLVAWYDLSSHLLQARGAGDLFYPDPESEIWENVKQFKSINLPLL
jgi:hypothetical protein